MAHPEEPKEYSDETSRPPIPVDGNHSNGSYPDEMLLNVSETHHRGHEIEIGPARSPIELEGKHLI